MSCPGDAQWAEFVVTRSEPSLERHLASCSACQATVAALTRLTEQLGRDDVGLESQLSVERVVATALRRRRPARRLMAIAASVTVLVGAGLAVRLSREETMTPRGEAPAWKERVSSRMVSTTTGLIEPGARLPASTRFSVAAFGVLATDRLFTLAFVVDAKGVVHWVAPAWLDEAVVPRAAPLAADGGFRTNPEHVLSLESSLAFDDLAPGPGAVVTLVLDEPVPVLAVERLTARDEAALRARFPRALVRRVPVEVHQ